MSYRGRIIEELKKDTKPGMLDLMNLCGVPIDDEEHHQFGIDMAMLMNSGKVVRVTTKFDATGEDVEGYYRLG